MAVDFPKLYRLSSRGIPHVLAALFLVIAVPFLLLRRLAGNRRGTPRLLFGSASIPSLPALAAAMRQAGYEAASVTVSGPGLPTDDRFDMTLHGYAVRSIWRRRTLGQVEAFIAFLRCVLRYDVFNLFFSGGVLRRTALASMELKLLRLAGVRVVMFPYGSDAFALDRIPYPRWREVLAADYPKLAIESPRIEERIRRFSADASAVVGCLVHAVCLPRRDHMMLTCYPVDTDRIEPAFPSPMTPIMRVFHAPNHRVVKGSQYLIEAVARLQAEGLPIELDLAERVPHHEVLARMRESVVVVDQLIFGYALTAMEGMALGKIVITGRNPDAHDALFADHEGYRNSPMLKASPETIEDVLRNLLASREHWHSIGRASRAYVEKWHSPAATARAWTGVYKRLGLPTPEVNGAREDASHALPAGLRLPH